MRSIRHMCAALTDRILLALPQRRTQDGFAFLIHPRDITDVYRKYPQLKIFPEWVTRFIISHLWPITVSEITGVKDAQTGSPIRGWIISCALTADMLMADREAASAHIIRAAKLAERRGARILGLGALTASLTRGGKDILPHIRGSVTTGRLFTTKIVTDIAGDAVDMLGIDRAEAEVAIMGAAGSIGSGCAQLLAYRGFKNINLVDLRQTGERLDRLRQLVRLINPHATVGIHNTPEALKTADVIIAVTNRPDSVIRSEHVRPGAVIVDDAQPSDVAPDVFLRDDALVLEGGVVHAPEIDVHVNMGLQHKEDIYSCLAEVILLASKGHFGHYSVGEIFELDMERLSELSTLSESYGFRRGEFQNYKTVYGTEDVVRVRQARDTVR